MLKMTASFVLVSKTSSMYPRGYTCGAFFACGLAGGHFNILLNLCERIELKT